MANFKMHYKKLQEGRLLAQISVHLWKFFVDDIRLVQGACTVWRFNSWKNFEVQ